MASPSCPCCNGSGWLEWTHMYTGEMIIKIAVGDAEPTEFRLPVDWTVGYIFTRCRDWAKQQPAFDKEEWKKVKAYFNGNITPKSTQLRYLLHPAGEVPTLRFL